jgi:3-hydroxymyristoyl/3-hydroxydecanoyl-(acyl carrier protein) dehydratase
MTMRDSIAAARISGPLPQADGTNRFEFRFPASDPTFAGHFPTRPLLPGVFQLEIARFAAELVLNQPLQVREIPKAKFLRPIIPEETVRVELKLAEKTDTIQVRASFSVTGQAAGEAFLSVTRNS